MNLSLGLDGGGTGTTAVLLDENTQEIARAVGGSSNFHSVGLAVAEASLRAAIEGVLSAADVAATDVRAVGLGLAGAGRPEERQTARDLLARIADFREIVITHDAAAALRGGVGRCQGVVLIAGTGALAYGVNACGESRRADGWGYLLGDEGSAYWIGRSGLRAVLRAHDGRGPATTLTDRMPKYLGASGVEGLASRVYAADFGVPQVAALAIAVSRAAQEGDAVAQDILRQAGRHLSETLAAVIRGLGMAEDAFAVVLTGGVLRGRGPVWQEIVARLHEIAPRARAIEPQRDAAVGAALLAREMGN